MGGGERVDVRRRVGGQAVLDPVQLASGGDRGADLGDQREVVAAAAARSERHAQAVVMQVVGTEDVTGAVALVVGRALASGRRRGAARAGGRPRILRADRQLFEMFRSCRGPV